MLFSDIIYMIFQQKCDVPAYLNEVAGFFSHKYRNRPGHMAKIYVAEIEPNQEVSSVFVATESQLRTARNGTPFLALKLTDKTGEIVGRMWENAVEAAEAISGKGLVAVRGRSETYRNEIQLNIHEISPVSVGDVDRTDFLPTCPLNTDELFDRLKTLLTSVKRRPLYALVLGFLGDRELMNRFKLAPAAKSMHHAYLGGLLEHTLSVASLTNTICSHYPELDRDLLLAGAFLHDIGKVEEYTYDLSIDYSAEGRLLGHMILGVDILEQKIRALKNFPEQDAVLLKHLILSHHGEAQFGAVKTPMTREAFVLHHVDDLDAKINTLGRLLADTRDGDDSWTSYQPMFARYFFRGFPECAKAPDQDCRGVREGQLSLWQNREA